ncbi:transposase [Allosaccharopolyspora coralli]|uniref:Transposase n=1 Tax=Allosaccharopolyspora coralli TaxID=2665642 RepID=A0A5Q3QHC5_9PSEU|nr:transposase [Allosaccharopolyspora coralli]QGK70227.1 transposase [Allosaccharopolyspora coralli]
MGNKRRRFDPEFRAGAVRIVAETGKPVAQVARELGVSSYTLHNWVKADRGRAEREQGELDEAERAELTRLRAEKAAWDKEKTELEMERDVLKRSVVLWVKDAMNQ